MHRGPRQLAGRRLARSVTPLPPASGEKGRAYLARSRLLCRTRAHDTLPAAGQETRKTVGRAYRDEHLVQPACGLLARDDLLDLRIRRPPTQPGRLVRARAGRPRRRGDLHRRPRIRVGREGGARGLNLRRRRGGAARVSGPSPERRSQGSGRAGTGTAGKGREEDLELACLKGGWCDMLRRSGRVRLNEMVESKKPARAEHRRATSNRPAERNLISRRHGLGRAGPARSRIGRLGWPESARACPSGPFSQAGHLLYAAPPANS